MNPSEWQLAFGSGADVILIESSLESLPTESNQFLSSHGIPLVVVFEGTRPFELKFDKLREPLKSFNEQLDEPEPIWNEQLAIGIFETCGVIWDICIDTGTGAVGHVDIEAYDDIGVVNSSVAQLGKSIIAVLQHFSATGRRCLHALSTELEEIDGIAYNGIRSFWKSFVENTIEFSEIENVTCDTGASKRRF